MGVGRVRAGAFVALGAVAAVLLARDAVAEPHRIEVSAVADADDDDDDGIVDSDEASLGAAASDDLSTIDGPRDGLALHAAVGTGKARVLVDGRPLAIGAAVPKGAAKLAIQGVAPGRVELDLGAMKIAVNVLGVTAVDATDQPVDFTTSNASIERTPPDRGIPLGAKSDDPDPDALRYVVVGARDDLPVALTLVSRAPDGDELDALDAVPLADMICPAGTAPDLACRATPLVRAVADDVDRNHPLVLGRSLRAEVGGTIAVALHGKKLQTIRVGGPRHTPEGPIRRLRGRLRITIVRDRAKGSAPFGGDDAGAIESARKQIAWTNALWGQCGITFGDPRDADVRVVDPPPPHLVAVGCDLGLPASGGEVRLRVEGRDVRAELAPGTKPRAAARMIARAIEAAGFSARVSENARIDPAAFPTADVLVRRRDGQLATVEAPADGRVSTDATLGACIGEVDLSDGLEHFRDVDAPAGTVEERTLVKAFDDGDPSSIDVLMVTAFAGGGRIGESFIEADGSSVRNVVIEDRAGVRADRASFALAHELGHVLLDMPGHPDDYGVDTPTLLMDSDAADPSAFGPRRLTVAECARALRQSGPGAPTVLLEPWPLSGPGASLPKRPAAVAKQRRPPR